MGGLMTRAQAESVIVSRCRAVLTRAGLATTGSPNADLNDPLATALDELGLPPGDRSAVIDLDLAPLAPSFQGRFIDLLEIRTLETALQQMIGLARSIQWEDYRKDSGDPFKNLSEVIDLKWARYNARWVQNATLVVGRMPPANHYTEHRGAYCPPFPGQPPWGYW